MPILTASQVSTAARRAVRLPGLPDFNAGDPAFKITGFEGWFDGQSPTPVLVANGGGPGAVAVGAWEPAEAYLTLSGWISANPESRAKFRTLLLAAFPPSVETSLVVLGNGRDVDKQVFVRLYDRPTFPTGDYQLNFTFPLVAPDPFKYGLTELSSAAGGFAVTDAYRTYEAAGAYRVYEAAGSYRFYIGEEDDSSLPKVAALSSDGDATSDRMTITVSGPLTSGEWWVEDVDGTRLWAEVSVLAGQTVTFDCRTRTATLDGAPIDHLVFGDYLSLAPGENAFRLIVGASGVGSHMTITALPAYQ